MFPSLSHPNDYFAHFTLSLIAVIILSSLLSRVKGGNLILKLIVPAGAVLAAGILKETADSKFCFVDLGSDILGISLALIILYLRHSDKK